MEKKDKEILEKQHSQQMNQEAVERIKKEQESVNSENIWFEYDEEIKLRDGKTYKIPPCSLRDAKRLMKLLKTVNVDVIILNFVPTDDDKADQQREQDLFDILLMGFKNYPHVDRDYIDKFVDLETARKIIDILIGINGLKK